MKHRPDYSSRFRILKGGKISLVVSSLVVSSALVTPAHSAVVTVNTALTTSQDLNGSIDSMEVTAAGSIIIANAELASVNVNSGMGSGSSLLNSGTISATASGKSFATGVNVDGSMSGTITNEAGGIITATGTGPVTAAGLVLNNGMETSSSLINSGTIEATSADYTAYGITTSNMNGTIANNAGATVSAVSTSLDAYGINMNGMGSGSSLLNSGTIFATASGKSFAEGVNVNGAMDGTIINEAGATISATSTSTLNGSADGIYLGSMGTASSLSNSGTISAIASGIIMGAVDVSGVYVNGLMDGTITNDAEGRILAITNSGSADGIRFNYGIEAGSSLLNSGTISTLSGRNGNGTGIYVNGLMNGAIRNNAGAKISARSASSYYMSADGIRLGSMGVASSLSNNGTISATASGNSNGTGVMVFGAMDGTITNNIGGTISATSTTGSAQGIYSASMAIGSLLSNSGTISATSKTANAYGIKVNNYFDGTLTNDGSITASANSAADKSAYSLSIASGTGAVTNTSTGTLNGNLIVGTGITLTNAGLVSLPHNANGLSSATVENFIQTATGTLELGLLTDGTTTSHSKLKTTNASFETGSTIAVNVLAASRNEDLLIGQILTDVVTATSNLTIGGVLNITDNSALLDFEYSTSLIGDANTIFVNSGAGAINLNVVEGTTIVDAVSTVGGNTNTIAAAAALDTIKDGNYPNMDTFIASLNTLATNAEVAQAVVSTTPAAATAAADVALQVSNSIQGIVQMRQRANFGGGLNSGEEVFGEKNLWIKPFGSLGKQDDKDGINGFDVNTAGFGLGFDGEYASNQKIGLAFFYARAKVDVNNMSQSSDMDVFSTLIYGNIPFLDDKTNFLYQAGYAWQKTRTDKLVGVEAINADYTSTTASLDLKVMRDVEVSDKLLLQPLVSATYRTFESPDYTETGGATALSVKKSNAEELVIGLGTFAQYTLDKDSRVIGNVNLGYDLADQQRTVSSSYFGASGVEFETDGINNGRWQYDLGVGYKRDVKEGHSINFAYNYQGQGSTFANHVLSAKYMYSF